MDEREAPSVAAARFSARQIVVKRAPERASRLGRSFDEPAQGVAFPVECPDEPEPLIGR